MSRVLIVDDEEPVRALLASTLRFAGHEVVEAGDGIAALACLEPGAPGRDPDLVVLDVMMPGLDGFELLSVVRRRGVELPVLFVTARGAVEDRVRGLRAGADDYVVKPFSVAEVTARVEALLRRAGTTTTDETLRLADLVLDPVAHRVTRGGEPVELSPTEYRLLEHLLRNAGRVLSKSQLLEHVWGYGFGGTNVVERFVSNLRRKVDADRPPLIHTVRGFGYTARVPE
ncbi:response regulator transcription factor [Nocardioides mangrovi]|uniref:Response regulator transcription factor n=1 Tax=Nocardioides mangrovi TaxID=2874580 RepID=A0ABS7UAL1_9ACTN|nr:response regulator transcription factor [Nocardioides mangrovi]MBZ5737682.1 response regulator transcription factor [Nocardioides mangrovi]